MTQRSKLESSRHSVERGEASLSFSRIYVGRTLMEIIKMQSPALLAFEALAGRGSFVTSLSRVVLSRPEGVVPYRHRGLLEPRSVSVACD